jgi:ABC-type antimicrobial peptide transport system permease subunit
MQMYTPQAQVTDSFLTIVMRSSADPSLLAAEARRTIWSVASDIPVYEIAPLQNLVARSVGPRRFVMILLEVFGIVAVLMTAIGVYGVISYSVAERTREIGIRAALGATPGNIVRLIVGSGLMVVCAGLGVGILAALGAARYLKASLYDVPAHDPLTFVTITLVLLVVAFGAQIVPIARALRVEPNVALRQE